MVSHLVERSCQRGYSTADHHYGLFESGEQQLWVIGEDGDALAIVVTDIQQYPAFKACRMMQCAGNDKKRWLHHLDDIKAWARSVGCDRMQAIARPGWAKVLNDFKRTHVILEREI